MLRLFLCLVALIAILLSPVMLRLDEASGALAQPARTHNAKNSTTPLMRSLQRDASTYATSLQLTPEQTRRFTAVYVARYKQVALYRMQRQQILLDFQSHTNRISPQLQLQQIKLLLNREALAHDSLYRQLREFVSADKLIRFYALEDKWARAQEPSRTALARPQSSVRTGTTASRLSRKGEPR